MPNCKAINVQIASVELLLSASHQDVNLSKQWRDAVMTAARDLFGFPEPSKLWSDAGCWTALHKILLETFDRSHLGPKKAGNRLVDLFDFFQNERSTAHLLAVVGAMLRFAQNDFIGVAPTMRTPTLVATTIQKLNAACRRDGIPDVFTTDLLR